MTKEEGMASYMEQRPTHTDSFSLQIRLSTQELIERFESFLRGATLTVSEDTNGNLRTKMIKAGRPKANEIGIQGLMGWVYFIINPHVVQGNFPLENKTKGYSSAYENFIYNLRIDLGQDLIINCMDWGLRDEEIPGIIDRFMAFSETFLSRLIGNEERNSYSQTMRSMEQITNRSKGVPMFKA